MNPLHYPSLELCKKLTEAGFGNTEKCFCPNCFGTGKECCNNPDHSFFDMCRAGGVGDAYGCPCCGGKIVMKGECDFCKSGIINSDEYDDMEKLFDDTTIILCPSVMELLDALPTFVEFPHGNLWLNIWIPNKNDVRVSYSGFIKSETLPNALAEMWLYLKENNYLTK